MRERLKEFLENEHWVYGLNVSDFFYTMRLAKEFAKAKLELLRQYAGRVREENPDSADDILDDISYYTHTDIEYVWHFCLWRLQAIFEGIMVYKILRTEEAEQLVGLRSKLEAIRHAGFTLEDADFNELVDWAKLRNILSHAPPEQYRPGPLQEADVIEYKELVERLSQLWLGQIRTESPEA